MSDKCYHDAEMKRLRQELAEAKKEAAVWPHLEFMRASMAADKNKAEHDRDSALASLAKAKEAVEAWEAKWPHFCAMDHEPIASVESGEDERCPVCRLRDGLEVAERSCAAWKSDAQVYAKNADHWRHRAELAEAVNRLSSPASPVEKKEDENGN